MQIPIPDAKYFVVESKGIKDSTFDGKVEIDLPTMKTLIMNGTVQSVSVPDYRFHYGYLYFVLAADGQTVLRVTTPDYRLTETYMSA